VYWAQALELFLGTVGGGTNQGDTYFTSAYTQDELDAEHVVYTDTVVDEGALLLYNNDKALPLAAGSSISIFGSASQQWFTNGTGSAAMAINPYASLTLKDSFEEAGFSVNGDLWDYYSENYTARGGGGSGASANWSLTEIPWNDLDSACGSTFGS
jgi:beta-glucosidase